MHLYIGVCVLVLTLKVTRLTQTCECFRSMKSDKRTWCVPLSQFLKRPKLTSKCLITGPKLQTQACTKFLQRDLNAQGSLLAGFPTF